MVPLHRPDLPVAVKMRNDWKLLCSFFKRDWEFEDYPIYACPWIPDAVPKPFPWQAYIIHWPSMHAGGKSGTEAIEKLRERFESYKRENKLPRPGRYRRSKIKFPATDRIVRHQQLKTEFVEDILQLPFAFISNESSLMDFDSVSLTPQQLVERIRSYYGVDVSDIPDAKIADIFDRIARTRGNKE